MLPEEWSILHQIEIVLETMARFQRVLEGKRCVTVSLVPVAVFQIRKGYQAVIDNNETLHQVKALTKILLADFDKRYHPASTIVLEPSRMGTYVKYPYLEFHMVRALVW
jgi:hypothetical protein